MKMERPNKGEVRDELGRTISGYLRKGREQSEEGENIFYCLFLIYFLLSFFSTQSAPSGNTILRLVI
jgi:hypothetical protein